MFTLSSRARTVIQDCADLIIANGDAPDGCHWDTRGLSWVQQHRPHPNTTFQELVDLCQTEPRLAMVIVFMFVHAYLQAEFDRDTQLYAAAELAKHPRTAAFLIGIFGGTLPLDIYNTAINNARQGEVQVVRQRSGSISRSF